MKQKLLAVFLALCMASGFCACGSSSSEIQQNEAYLTEENTQDYETDADNMDANTETDLDTETDLGTETDTADGSTTGTDDSLDETSIDESNDLSGLIIMTEDYSSTINSSNHDILYISISSLDIESGEQHTNATFSIGNGKSDDFIDYAPNNAHGQGHFNLERGIYHTYREWFNDDYTKMAITRYDNNKGETHAGWLDENGNFFDVTEKLGLQSEGDFSDPANYEAVGFTEEYYAYRDNNIQGGFYYVPVGDISTSAVIKGSPFPNGDDSDRYNSIYKKYDITDWIDSHTFFYNTGDVYSAGSSVILDLETEETKTYIPGSSRNNWNGVLSPDGTEVAFMSEPLSGNEGAGLFITPLSGDGEPARVTTDIELLGMNIYYNGRDYDSCFDILNFLIDWK